LFYHNIYASMTCNIKFEDLPPIVLYIDLFDELPINDLVKGIRFSNYLLFNSDKLKGKSVF